VARVEQHTDGKWHLTLELTDKSTAAPTTPQRRAFDSKSCENIAETAAVALALALGERLNHAANDGAPNDNPPDSNADSENAPKAASHPAEASIASAAPPKTKSIPTKPTPSTNWWWRAQLQGVLDIGTLPSVSPGASAGAMLGYRSLGLRASGLVLPERQSSASGPGGDFRLIAGTLAVCGLTRDGRNFSLCAGAEVGQLSAEGTNVTRKQRGTSLWVAPSLDAAWALRLSDGVSLLVSGGAVTPLVRKSFEIRNVGEVHRPNSLVWRLGLGLQFDWY
jgi:hypothetical protein